MYRLDGLGANFCCMEHGCKISLHATFPEEKGFLGGEQILVWSLDGVGILTETKREMERERERESVYLGGALP